MLKISLEKFEGPLDLLLELVESQKLDICELSLAQVTDQYLEIINHETLPAQELADFLVVASRLLLVKSKTLLPFLSLSEEEETEIKDLELALQEYRRYKNQSKIIKEILHQNHQSYARSLWQSREIVFQPPKQVQPGFFADLLKNLILSWEKFILPKADGYLEKTFSVEERISEIIKKIEEKAILSFNNLVGRGAKKIDIIISFLAVLFLFREKTIALEQKSEFGEINVSKNNLND